MVDENLDDLAKFIAFNPKLRSDYFMHPGRVLARAIPRKGGLAVIWPGVSDATRTQRVALGSRVEDVMSGNERLITARAASSFLTNALQNPQRTFNAIVGLSILAFVMGGSLLIGAFLAAVFGDGTTEKAVLGGLSGGGGAAITLGTLLAISRKGIRKANSDDAQIRLVLNGFAAEMSYFNSVPWNTGKVAWEEGIGHAKTTSRLIREATVGAVTTIAKYVVPQQEYQMYTEPPISSPTPTPEQSSGSSIEPEPEPAAVDASSAHPQPAPDEQPPSPAS